MNKELLSNRKEASHSYQEFFEGQPWKVDMPERAGNAGEDNTFLAVPCKTDKKYSERPTSLATRSISLLVGDKATIAEPSNGKCVTSFKTAILEQVAELDERFQLIPSANDNWWQRVSSLRQLARSPPKNLESIDRLLEYYQALLYIQNHYGERLGAITFTWNESLFPQRQVASHDIAYEQASVLFNIGAIYSQLGAGERLWTENGRKQAADYFQKAAGYFFYLRETFYLRLRHLVFSNADMHEDTLTCIGSVLLAQAAECYYEKANSDHASSSLISMLAAYVSDLYRVAVRQTSTTHSVPFKSSLPSLWTSTIKTKVSLFGGISHFHSPPNLSAERIVSERLARLQVAEENIAVAVKIVHKKSVLLHELQYALLIRNATLMVESANYACIHQTPFDKRLLSPLKRPSKAIVMPVSPPEDAISLPQDYQIKLLQPERLDKSEIDFLLKSLNQIVRETLSFGNSECQKIEFDLNALEQLLVSTTPVDSFPVRAQRVSTELNEIQRETTRCIIDRCLPWMESLIIKISHSIREQEDYQALEMIRKSFVSYREDLLKERLEFDVHAWDKDQLEVLFPSMTSEHSQKYSSIFISGLQEEIRNIKTEVEVISRKTLPTILCEIDDVKRDWTMNDLSVSKIYMMKTNIQCLQEHCTALVQKIKTIRENIVEIDAQLKSFGEENLNLESFEKSIRKCLRLRNAMIASFEQLANLNQKIKLRPGAPNGVSPVIAQRIQFNSGEDVMNFINQQSEVINTYGTTTPVLKNLLHKPQHQNKISNAITFFNGIHRAKSLLQAAKKNMPRVPSTQDAARLDSSSTGNVVIDHHLQRLLKENARLRNALLDQRLSSAKSSETSLVSNEMVIGQLNNESPEPNAEATLSSSVNNDELTKWMSEQRKMRLGASSFGNVRRDGENIPGRANDTSTTRTAQRPKASESGERATRNRLFSSSNTGDGSNPHIAVNQFKTGNDQLARELGKY